MDSVPSGTPTNCWPSYFHPGATRPDGVFVALRSWFCDGKNEWDVWWFSKELLNSSWINARRIAKKRCHVLSTEARWTGSSSKDSGGISSTHRISPRPVPPRPSLRPWPLEARADIQRLALHLGTLLRSSDVQNPGSGGTGSYQNISKILQNGNPHFLFSPALSISII